MLAKISYLLLGSKGAETEGKRGALCLIWNCVIIAREILGGEQLFLCLCGHICSKCVWLTSAKNGDIGHTFMFAPNTVQERKGLCSTVYFWLLLSYKENLQKDREKCSNFLFERRGSVLTWKTTFATWRTFSSAKINCWSFSLNPYFLDHAGLYCANCLYHPGRISVGEACISYFLMPPSPLPIYIVCKPLGKSKADKWTHNFNVLHLCCLGKTLWCFIFWQRELFPVEHKEEIPTWILVPQIFKHTQ